MIGSAWIITFVISMLINVHLWSSSAILGFILLRSFLHTGLFIVAHDAMHHSLAPLNEKLNNNIGRLCLFLYAGLSYKSCSKNHSLHHRYPESAADPDFHSIQNSKPINWYFRFLSNYLDAKQFCVLTIVWLLLLQITSSVNPNAAENIIIFCPIPLIISSIQLFFVGTCLPHQITRKEPGRQRPRSLSLHPLLSFAACYHFGYHLEHHLNPNTPWFKLPNLRVASLQREQAKIKHSH
ncbi:fatty acid desaturase [bacterium]|nr:fatty acid desaturase [bacterium]